MLKKVLMTGLMLAVVLSASACGKDSVGTSGTVEDTSIESPVADSQPTEAETHGTAEESLQPAEELAEEVSGSYIFSEMPIAAYEVTGLGLGPDDPVYEGNLISEYGDDMGQYQFITKTPGENTYVLYCFLGGDASKGTAFNSVATVRSPAGSSQWNCYPYGTLQIREELVPEGYTWILRFDPKSEEKCEGRFTTYIEPWTRYIYFSGISHADAPQSDTILAIDITPFTESLDGFSDVDSVMEAVVQGFEEWGATIQEISVEDALARNNIIVSKESAN
ncbi:MAG: hypothetical protein K2O32_00370 [Acetatifactor sp.]|nr:hypothetical protein [Acetatifactor sp.]